MAYRNVAAGPDGIIAHALATVERANRIARARTFVGVETDKVSAGVPAKVTFAGKSMLELNAQVEATEAALAGHPSYAGIAFHRYVTFRDLASGSR